MTDDSGPLLDRLERGDADAGGELLRRHLPSLLAYVRLNLGPRLRQQEASVDIVQSVCVEVLRALPDFTYRGEAQFRQWLFCQALHKIINKNRHYTAGKRDVGRARPLATDSGADAALAECYQSVCSPSRVAIAREAVATFEAAFATLPDDYREAITLRRIVGLSFEEIAAAMNRSQGAVRNLVYRGLARLAPLIGKSE